MLKLLGSILGTEKALERTVNAVSAAVDKIWFTDEEKAEAKAKKAEFAQLALMDWIKATNGQNKARRVLALLFSFTWVAQYAVANIMEVAAVWLPEYADRLVASATAIDARADSMTGAIMLILGFYFAAPHMDKWVDKAMDRFAGKK